MTSSPQCISFNTRFINSTGHGAPLIMPVRRLVRSKGLPSWSISWSGGAGAMGVTAVLRLSGSGVAGGHAMGAWLAPAVTARGATVLTATSPRTAPMATASENARAAPTTSGDADEGNADELGRRSCMVLGVWDVGVTGETALRPDPPGPSVIRYLGWLS